MTLRTAGFPRRSARLGVRCRSPRSYGLALRRRSLSLLARKEPRMARAKKAASKRPSRKTTSRRPAPARRTRKATTSQFVCQDCGFVAKHAMGLGRHRSARHGAVSKRQARSKVAAPTPGWLTRQQAAERAGVHYNTIRIWERSGLLGTQKHGARNLLSADDLDRVVRDRGAAPAAAVAGGTGGADVAALERRFEALLDGLERLVASARTAEPRRRPGRPLGSRNKPKATAAARKPAKRGRPRKAARARR